MTENLKKDSFHNQNEMGVKPFYRLTELRALVTGASRGIMRILILYIPFVIITTLGDYAVTYKLRAYTTNAKAMFQIRSNLMANVQEQFYSHGVEILSPWYLVRREEKIPTGQEVMDTWDTTDKKTEEVIAKEAEESITDSFGLMDKAMSEEK